MKNQSQHKLATISFAVDGCNGIDLWPQITGDQVEAITIGRARAAEILEYALKNQAPMILGHVTAAIIRKGLFGHGETSFFHAVAIHCMKSAVDEPAVAEQPIAVNPESRPALRLVKN